MAEPFSRFDAADYLQTPSDIQAYLDAAAEDGDPAVLAAALGAVARARNMAQLAREIGMTREGLYKALSPGGNPAFGTVAKVARALGFKLALRPAGENNGAERAGAEAHAQRRSSSRSRQGGKVSAGRTG